MKPIKLFPVTPTRPPRAKYRRRPMRNQSYILSNSQLTIGVIFAVLLGSLFAVYTVSTAPEAPERPTTQGLPR